MKNKKAYIILIVILFIFFLVMFLSFGLGSLKNSGNDTTLIVGDDTVWKYNDGRWKNLNSYDDINWKKYDVYLNNEKFGNYYLLYDNKWYAFDDDKNAVMLDGDLFAFKSNVDISISAFNTNEVDDLFYVYKVLENNKLPKNSEFTSNYKLDFDLDNDGELEQIYVVSNAFPIGFDPDKIFSLVFMVKNEEIYPIYTNISKNSGFNGCKPYISNIIDINSDSKYELILSCAKYSTNGVTRMLYEFKNTEFRILISNNK